MAGESSRGQTADAVQLERELASSMWKARSENSIYRRLSPRTIHLPFSEADQRCV